MKKTSFAFDIFFNLFAMVVGFVLMVVLYYLATWFVSTSVFAFIYNLFTKTHSAQNGLEYALSFVLPAEIIPSIIVVQKMCSITNIKIRFGALIFSLFCVAESIISSINYIKICMQYENTFSITTILIFVGVIGASVYSVVKSIKYTDKDDMLWR